MGHDGLKLIEAVRVAEVSHSDAHRVLEEGASIINVAVQVLSLKAEAGHVLLIGSILEYQLIMLGLKNEYMFPLTLAELLGSLAVAKDLVFGLGTHFRDCMWRDQAEKGANDHE